MHCIWTIVRMFLLAYIACVCDKVYIVESSRAESHVSKLCVLL